MDQDATTPRRRWRGLVAGMLAAGAFGAFAVGAVASGGEGGESTRTAPSAPVPSFVQDEGQQDRDGRDCPFGEGERQQAPQGESAPDTGVQL